MAARSPAATTDSSEPRCFSPRADTASGNNAMSSSAIVTFLHSTHRRGMPGPSSIPSSRLSPRTFSRKNAVYPSAHGSLPALKAASSIRLGVLVFTPAQKPPRG